MVTTFGTGISVPMFCLVRPASWSSESGTDLWGKLGLVVTIAMKQSPAFTALSLDEPTRAFNRQEKLKDTAVG